MDKHRIVLDPKSRTVRRTDGSLYSIRTIGGSPKKHERNEYEYDGESSPGFDPDFKPANIAASEYNRRDSIGKLSYNSKKRYGFDGYYNAYGEPVHEVYNKKYRRGKRVSHDALYSIELKDDYLAHHGIKGQKWGVRNYQNEDGTLTEAGKKRYGVDSETGKMSKEGKTNYAIDNWKVRRHRKIERYTNKGVRGINRDLKREDRIKNKLSKTTDNKKLDKLNDRLNMVEADRKMKQALQKLQHEKIDSFTKDDIKKIEVAETKRYVTSALISIGSMAMASASAGSGGVGLYVVSVPRPTTNYLSKEEVNKVANKYGKETKYASYTGYRVKNKK